MPKIYAPDPKDLHTRYIHATRAKSIVADIEIFLCNLTNTVVKKGDFKSKKVYLNTKVLKHLYDKRPAEEYDAILERMVALTRLPDRLYQNMPGQTATKCFYKNIRGIKYLLCLQEKGSRNEVVTCFRLREERKQKYLKTLEQIWSWEDDEPPS